MPDEATIQSAEPASLPPGPKNSLPRAVGRVRSAWAARVKASPLAARRSRRRWKKILVPAVLGVIGAAVIVVGLWMYPRRPEVSVPAAPTVEIDGSSPYVNNHMKSMYYFVSPARPGVTYVSIEVTLGGPPYASPGGNTRVPRGAFATIQFWPGAKMVQCLPGCVPAGKYGQAHAQFGQQPGESASTATAIFYVRARSYEVAANGATAAVGFPQMDYSGTRQAGLNVEYENLPSAGSYDWSAFPPDAVDSAGALWSETVLPAGQLLGGGSARVATGVNHAAQQRDTNFTLAAGVLFGIGGAALVAAVQEALHD